MKKRILATVMTLTLGAAMLTACGSTAEDVNTSVETDVVDTATVPTEEATVPATEDVDSTEEATTEEADTEDVDSTEEAATDEAATEDVDSTEEAATEDVDSTEEAATDEATTEEAAN